MKSVRGQVVGDFIGTAQVATGELLTAFLAVCLVLVSASPESGWRPRALRSVAGISSRSGIRENSAVVRVRIVGLRSAPVGCAGRGRILSTSGVAEFSRILLRGERGPGKVAGRLAFFARSVAGILYRSGIRENSAVVRVRIAGLRSAPLGSAGRGKILSTSGPRPGRSVFVLHHDQIAVEAPAWLIDLRPGICALKGRPSLSESRQVPGVTPAEFHFAIAFQRDRQPDGAAVGMGVVADAVANPDEGVFLARSPEPRRSSGS